MAFSETKTLKSKHLQLAEIVKGVHRKLRRQFRESDGDFSRVWKSHLENKDILLSYAHAMQRLAEEHWAVFPETRIDWCRKIILEYFLSDGWRKALEKDAKRKHFEEKRLMQLNGAESHDGENSLNATNNCNDRKSKQLVDVKNDHLHQCCTPSESEQISQEDDSETFSLPYSTLSRLADIEDKIRLLDVGSCYNAFSSCDRLETVGIDLCPANESVFQCDFLQLQISPSDDSPQFPPLKSPITRLPASKFHVVVFCLLLEYLPSTLQRFQCCVKAHGLLSLHGLLLIVTPDSHSQHKNSPMIKSWRDALETVGFSRWKYEKKEHIHCIAFRKVSDVPVDFIDDEVKIKECADKLYIPQDFNDACYVDVVPNPNSKPTEEDKQMEASNETFRMSALDELPSIHSLDDGSDDDTL